MKMKPKDKNGNFEFHSLVKSIIFAKKTHFSLFIREKIKALLKFKY